MQVLQSIFTSRQGPHSDFQLLKPSPKNLATHLDKAIHNNKVYPKAKLVEPADLNTKGEGVLTEEYKSVLSREVIRSSFLDT